MRVSVTPLTPATGDSGDIPPFAIPADAHLLAHPTQRLEARSGPVGMNLGLVFNCYAEFAQHFGYANGPLAADKLLEAWSPGIGAVASILFLSSVANELVGIEPPGFCRGIPIPRLGPELIPIDGELVD